MADTVNPELPVETMADAAQPEESKPLDWGLFITGGVLIAIILLAIGIAVCWVKIKGLAIIRRLRANRRKDPRIRDLELQPRPTTPGQRHMRDLEAARAANANGPRPAPPCHPHPHIPVNPQVQPSSRQRHNDRVLHNLAHGARPERQPAWPRADSRQAHRGTPAPRPSPAPRAPVHRVVLPVSRALPAPPPVDHHGDVSFGSETTRVPSFDARPSRADQLPDAHQFQFSEHAQPEPTRADSPYPESHQPAQYPLDAYQFEFSHHARPLPHRAHPSRAAIERAVSPLDTCDITSSDARASIVSALSEDEHHHVNMPAAPEPTVNPYGWSHTPRFVGPRPSARPAGPPRQAPPRRPVPSSRPSESAQPGVDLSNLYRPNN